MMEIGSGTERDLRARVAERLESGEIRRLFNALVEAQERGGGRAVKELVTNVLHDELASRAEDAEERKEDME